MIRRHLRLAILSIGCSGPRSRRRAGLAAACLIALTGCSAPFIGEVNVSLSPSLGGADPIGEEEAADDAAAIETDCPTYKRMPATIKKLIPVVRKSAAPDKAEIEAWIGWLADSVQPFLTRSCGPGDPGSASGAGDPAAR